MDIDFAFRPDAGLPESAFAKLRQAGPVVWSDALNGWLVSSFDDAKTVLGDVKRFTMQGTPVAETLGGQAMLVDDTPFHHTVRAVWAKAVSREAITARSEELERFAAQAIATVRPRLEAGETVDFIPVFREFVMQFIASSFGVPRDKLAVFERWSELSAETPALALPEGSPERLRHDEARQAVLALVAGQIADRKRRMAAGEVCEDLTALMVAAEGREGITAENVTDNLFNFILGAMDTTEKWLGNIMVKLYSDPDLLAEVSADRSLVEPFAEEVMRVHTVAQTVQRCVREGGAELSGQKLHGGDAVFLMLGAANRDPSEFSDPDRFDMHRRHGSHIGFGFAFHHCLGVNIARQEARAFISVLLDRLPLLRIVDVDWGNSWALWGPRGLQVAIDGVSHAHG
ncbi:MAG: cytochrome P450 [Novosphingobium sp.]|nr:cytochrome P450 [Novosphingobium sp.]